MNIQSLVDEIESWINSPITISDVSEPNILPLLDLNRVKIEQCYSNDVKNTAILPAKVEAVETREQKLILDKFPVELVNSFKHVIYNMLVDNHNYPDKYQSVMPCYVLYDGEMKTGFFFSDYRGTDVIMAELYSISTK
jgi:hypothetical protein